MKNSPTNICIKNVTSHESQVKPINYENKKLNQGKIETKFL